MSVQHGGTLRPVGGNRARRALAMLALAADRPVGTAQLIDGLWPDDPPATCRDQIYNCMTGLRRVLRPVRNEAVIEPVGGGYRLRLDPNRVDAIAFETSLRRAADLTRAGHAAQAARELAAALKLWRGEPLQGITDGVLGAAAVRLERLHGEAWHQRIATQRAASRDSDLDPGLIGEMYAAVERLPLHEGLVRELATVLWESGRPAEALTACQEHRRRLAAEVGVDVGPAVRDLESRIRQARPVRATEPPSTNDPAPCQEASRLLAHADLLINQIRAHLGDHHCASQR
ncbi:AfsR/SARP family transcriptional regulator [Mangrovihabitans endophyticus]|uniref:AfsR/SARP family transcriptional regulator n=1 Tax=Mangrovihabitans endophyticus TaxID=1751298 RepID=UPI00166A8FB5|nr:BTAD domain-containing putative transcriptional regulator [Mangrovihabitans endophyticus]